MTESDTDDVFTRVLLEQFVVFHRIVAAECPRYVEQKFYDDIVFFFDLRNFLRKKRNHFAVVESFFQKCGRRKKGFAIDDIVFGKIFPEIVENVFEIGNRLKKLLYGKKGFDKAVEIIV